jgi:Ran GTPase-activating protein (RanGAP) involved in mRNA processing and transport
VDKVADVHMALTHFKEPLQHRKGLCLTFNNIALSDNDLEVICDIVESNDTCKALCFRQNLISAQGAARLAKALKKNKSITSLELDYNKIKDEGLIALAEAVYYHRNLEVLSLAGNQIGDAGCSALMTAMMDSQKKTGEPHRMKHLQFSNNLVGDPGAKALARMIRKNETVEMLSLSCNSLTDKGVGYILEVADKHALPLKSLMLARNQLSSKTLIKLAEYLTKVDREVEIDLGENKLITGKGVQAILATHVPIEIQDFRIVKKDKNAALEAELVEDPAALAAETPTI